MSDRLYYRVRKPGLVIGQTYDIGDVIALTPAQAMFHLPPYAAALEEIGPSSTMADDIVEFRRSWLGTRADDPVIDATGHEVRVGARYYSTATGRVRILLADGWHDDDAATQAALAAQADAAAAADVALVAQQAAAAVAQQVAEAVAGIAPAMADYAPIDSPDFSGSPTAGGTALVTIETVPAPSTFRGGLTAAEHAALATVEAVQARGICSSDFEAATDDDRLVAMLSYLAGAPYRTVRLNQSLRLRDEAKLLALPALTQAGCSLYGADAATSIIFDAAAGTASRLLDITPTAVRFTMRNLRITAENAATLDASRSLFRVNAADCELSSLKFSNVGAILEAGRDAAVARLRTFDWTGSIAAVNQWVMRIGQVTGWRRGAIRVLGASEAVAAKGPAITAVSNTNPCTVTCSRHNIAVGDVVYVEGCGTTLADNTYIAAAVANDVLTLHHHDGTTVDTSATASYAGGGYLVAGGALLLEPGDTVVDTTRGNDMEIWTAGMPHGYWLRLDGTKAPVNLETSMGCFDHSTHAAIRVTVGPLVNDDMRHAHIRARTGQMRGHAVLVENLSANAGTVVDDMLIEHCITQICDVPAIKITGVDGAKYRGCKIVGGRLDRIGAYAGTPLSAAVLLDYHGDGWSVLGGLQVDRWSPSISDTNVDYAVEIGANVGPNLTIANVNASACSVAAVKYPAGKSAHDYANIAGNIGPAGIERPAGALVKKTTSAQVAQFSTALNTWVDTGFAITAAALRSTYHLLATFEFTVGASAAGTNCLFTVFRDGASGGVGAAVTGAVDLVPAGADALEDVTVRGTSDQVAARVVFDDAPGDTAQHIYRLMMRVTANTGFIGANSAGNYKTPTRMTVEHIAA